MSRFDDPNFSPSTPQEEKDYMLYMKSKQMREDNAPSWLEQLSSKAKEVGDRFQKNESGDMELPESLKPLAEKLKPVKDRFQKNEEMFGGARATPSAKPSDGGLSKMIQGQSWAYQPKKIQASSLSLGSPDEAKSAKIAALKKMLGM